MKARLHSYKVRVITELSECIPLPGAALTKGAHSTSLKRALLVGTLLGREAFAKVTPPYGCQSLALQQGPRVEQFPRGWEPGSGVMNATITQRSRDRPAQRALSPTARGNATH